MGLKKYLQSSNMTYAELIETVSLIVENEKIHKTGLILQYTLEEKNHKQMQEELFFRANPPATPFTPNDEFEVVVANIVVKFIKG